MPREVVCTIGSRKKRDDQEPLPARDRYIGAHIKTVAEIAKRRELPLFFVSGMFGFISEKEQISNYDYLLEPAGIAALAEKMRPQLMRYGIEEVYFYTKLTPAWKPYLAAVQQATVGLGVTLHVELFAE
jgi:hypothetical protein